MLQIRITTLLFFSAIRISKNLAVVGICEEPSTLTALFLTLNWNVHSVTVPCKSPAQHRALQTANHCQQPTSTDKQS